jgi:hypothetical protein
MEQCENCKKLESELANLKHALKINNTELENVKNAIYSEKMINLENEDRHRIVSLIRFGFDLSEHDKKMAEYYSINLSEIMPYDIIPPRATKEISQQLESCLKENFELEKKLKISDHRLKMIEIELNTAKEAIESYRSEIKNLK